MREWATRVGADGLPVVGWSLTFYWCLKGLCHCHHHIGAKYLKGEERSLEGSAGRWEGVAVCGFSMRGCLQWAGEGQGAKKGSRADVKLRGGGHRHGQMDTSWGCLFGQQ